MGSRDRVGNESGGSGTEQGDTDPVRNPNQHEGSHDRQPYETLEFYEDEWSGKYPRWSGGGGFQESANATPPRQMAVSGTILNAIITATYGEDNVTGLYGAVYPDLNRRFCYCGVVMGHGEQVSMSNIKLNGEDIALTQAWLAGYETRLGADTQAISTIMDAGITGADGWAETWPGLCCIFLKIDLASAELPGSLTVTADLGGRIITDFRDSSTGAFTNPVLVAYDIMTASDIWLGLPTTVIEENSWTTIADWCDEDPGDGGQRWSWNGELDKREPEAALKEVLSHCFAVHTPYYEKYALVADMPPPAASGTWTAADSKTVAGVGGAATTELEAGDIVFIGDDPRIIDTVDNNNQITVTVAVTASAHTIRITSGIYLKTEDMVSMPNATEIPAKSIPDRVLVRYTNASTGKPDVQLIQPAVALSTTGDYIQTEIAFSGINNASMAERAGQVALKVRSKQIYFWDCSYKEEKSAQLLPGDVCFCDFEDGFEFFPVRVMEKSENMDGTFTFEFQQYSIDAVSDLTKTDGTPPTINPGFTTEAPTGPTGISLKWTRGQSTGLADEDDASRWDTSGTAPTITDDDATAPDGDANADRLAFTGNGLIQNLETIASRPGSSERYVQLIWMKSQDGSDVEMTLQSTLTTGYTRDVNVRGHFRLYRCPALWTHWPDRPGPAISGGSGDDIHVCGAKFWVGVDEVGYFDGFEMEWTPAIDSFFLSRYELQYKLKNMNTSVVSDWITHVWVSPAAAKISWGNMPGADAPHLPGTDTTGSALLGFFDSFDILYDWRVVAVRGSTVTELIPTTVTEAQKLDMGTSNLKAADQITAVPVDGHLVGVTTSNGQVVTNTESVTKKVVKAHDNFDVTDDGVTLDDENYLCRCDASGGAFTLNLPAAASVPSREYVFKKLDSSANYITIDPDGSEKIDRADTVAVESQDEIVRIRSTGTTWDIIG